MMYNRYIPSGTSYTRVTEEDAAPPTAPREAETAGEKKGGLSALLKGLKLENMDTGDILLLLIMLFLFLEGDDIELIITLGLLLLLGLS
ncbi:MAG: hypothetical protein RRY53_06505 [Pseudoflavonifractor sp.]